MKNKNERLKYNGIEVISMDSKLTEEQIIKALECCKNAVSSDACKYCPLYGETDHTCITILSKNSLDLINRKKTDNKRLQHEISELKSELKTEIEKLEKAVREGLEKAINKICKNVSAPTPIESHIVERCNEEIFNLLKEIEEEKNGQ